MTIRKEFSVHMLNEHGKEIAGRLAEEFTVFLNRLETLCGMDGREMSIVRTKLEEASFFAKKAMASREQFHD